MQASLSLTSKEQFIFTLSKRALVLNPDTVHGQRVLRTLAYSLLSEGFEKEAQQLFEYLDKDPEHAE